MKQIVKIIFISTFYSLTGQFPLSAQYTTEFRMSDGLVDNHVYSIYLDSLKQIWFGTGNGLSVFREIKPETFLLNDSLIHKKVNSIIQDLKGHLWFGTDDGISVYDCVNWSHYTNAKLKTILRAKQVSCLLLDSQNNIWIGTVGGGITRLASDRQTWTTFDRECPGITCITAINEDSQGQLWFGTLDSGIVMFDGYSTWKCDFDDRIGTRIHTIFKDRDEFLWVGTEKGVIKTFDGCQWQPLFNTSNEPLPPVRAIAEDREGSLWFGTESGLLYKYDRNACHETPIRLDHTIKAMTLDHLGYIWIGTDGGGVARLHLNWQRFSQDYPGLDANHFTAIAEDTSGNLWIASKRNDIFTYNGRSFSRIFVDGRQNEMNRINDIIVDNHNRIWCATDYGIHSYDPGTRKWLDSFIIPKKDPKVRTLSQDRNGMYWFGTWHGVFRYDGTNWSIIDTTDGLPAMIINAIYQDHSGHTWIGTDGGGVCECVDTTIVVVYNTDNGLASNTVTAITQDRDDTYWFGTLEGIHTLTGDRSVLKNVTGEAGNLPRGNVSCLYRDQNDNIWVGTFNGDLVKFDNHFWWDYTGCQNGEQMNAIFQSAQQNFWFATTTGLVKYIPDRNPPKTILDLKPDSVIGIGAATFTFGGIDTETPNETLVFTHTLERSNDLENNNFSTRGVFNRDRFATVYPPANGRYTFHVAAMDADGNIDPSPPEYTFLMDITPPTTIITRPYSNEIVSGVIAIIGTAIDHPGRDDFNYYWLSYARCDSNLSIHELSWQVINNDTIATPVLNQELIKWDTGALPGGEYALKLSAIDSLEHLSEYPVYVTIVEKLLEIPAATGGELNGARPGIKLVLPPGALSKDTVKVFYDPVDLAILPPYPGDQIRYSNLAYCLGPTHEKLKKPATLCIYYAKVSIGDFEESRLSVARLVSPDSLELLGGVVEPGQGMIRTVISQLDTFILVEDNSNKKGARVITELNCQPRVFSPRGNEYPGITTISFKLAGNFNVSIKVYNLAGRLVRTLVANRPARTGFFSVDWDGRDDDNEYCASDLYLVVVASENLVQTKPCLILDKSKN